MFPALLSPRSNLSHFASGKLSPRDVSPQVGQRRTTPGPRTAPCAGTDTPNPFVYPGFSLHDELALLVEAGLSPRSALAAATTAPAEFLGATDSLGAVAEGKLADLVLLAGNPLEEIGNTRGITLVVANGRVFSREDLDALLEQVRRERAPGAP